ncbi:aldo/keto reductase [bacterium]|nr:aldo/keto reductase [bacterium]
MELGLGTVQFGLDYGVSNPTGKVPEDAIRVILAIARENGIRVLDTAVAYGNSERVLGSVLDGDHHFRIVSKLPSCKKDAITRKDCESLKVTFFESLERLRLQRAAGLLLHAPGDLFLPGGEEIYTVLASLKAEGLVEKIGISVYSGDEIDRVFCNYDFDLVQLPLNVLDQRLAVSGHLARLRARKVEIHVRSAFLQGLLLMPTDSINPFFSPVLPVLRRYRTVLDEHGLSPVDGALGYLRTRKEIDVILIGVTSEQELRINCKTFGTELSPDIDFSEFAVRQEAMIDPRKWKLT